MGTWNNAPQVPPVPPLGYGQLEAEQIKALHGYVKKMANVISALSKDLEFLLNGHLDVKNIRAEGIETRNLKAGSVVADKIDVDQLSAISADLGTITAGLIQSIEIFGSYIATRTGYPRAEMSATDDLFGVYLDASRYIQMATVASFLYTRFANGSSFLDFNSTPSGVNVQGTGNFSVAVPGYKIDLIADQVRIMNWSSLFNTDLNESLQDRLNSISGEIANLWTALAGKSNVGHTHTVSISNHNHGITPGSTVATTDGGSAGTFSSSGGGTYTTST